MPAKLLRDAIILLTTIDPIGTVLVFASLTATFDARARAALARRAVIIAGITLLLFLAMGQMVLGAMHISLASFQIAGGLFLLLFGIQMTFGDVTRHAGGEGAAGQDPAVFPLAIPAIASPGALLAVVVLTDNARYSLGAQVTTGVVLVAILAVTYVGMRLATPLLKLIGQSGGAALIRILGMILAALAVELAIEGLGQMGVIALPSA